MSLFQLAKAWPKSAILVYLFIKESGMQPVGVIADACNLSQASVYAALKVISKILETHDHDQDHKSKKEPSKKLEAAPKKLERPEADPMLAKLKAFGVWDGVIHGARQALRNGTLTRAQLQEQITWHEYRLAHDPGWFKGAPAAYLTWAIKNIDQAKQPPDGYHAARQPKAPDHHQPAAPAATPQPAPEPRMTLEQAKRHLATLKARRVSESSPLFVSALRALSELESLDHHTRNSA